jgi:hypothetical protein
MINPFEKNFDREYELALKIGKARFGSECKHEVIKNGHCVNCLRRIYILKTR